VKWTADRVGDLSGTTAVVTGANSGIGWHTAKELAAHGARVVLAVRDVERGKQAADRMRSSIGDEAAGQLEVAHVDLASMASVREFGENWVGPLHLLVNNAGVMEPPKRLATQDGFELQFGTNHLAHFVLTGLLLDALCAAAKGRVVTVSSTAHHVGKADVVEGNAGDKYDSKHTYGNSKLANLLFMRELQRQFEDRGLPLTSTAAHPGVAATGLVADPQGMGANPVIRRAAPVFLTLFTQSAAQGARATLYAATEAEPGSFTGPGRFAESRGPIGPAKLSTEAKDDKLARRLWQVSEEMTGFHYHWPSSSAEASSRPRSAPRR
jgi:NAD(P)-dependent dehydrogenase (short-subunit alcohol dehydrogenase family)